MTKKDVLAKLNEQTDPKGLIALIVNVEKVDDDNIHIIAGIGKPGKNLIPIPKSLIKNIDDFDSITKKFEQKIVVLEKSGDAKLGGQVPAITQRPCPITWTRFELENDDLNFDII